MLDLDGRLSAFGMSRVTRLSQSGRNPVSCWSLWVEEVGLCAQMGEMQGKTIIIMDDRLARLHGT